MDFEKVVLSSGDLTTSTFNGMAVDPTNPAHAWVTAHVYQDGFVAKISNDGKSLLWSTFYGGSNWEDVQAVIIDGAGNVWIAGSTASEDLPGLDGPQPPSGPPASTLFLAEISDATAACSWQLDPQTAFSPASGGVVNLAVTAPSGCAWTTTPTYTWISTAHSPAGTGSATIAAAVSANNTSATRTGSITLGGQTFTINQPSSSCQYSVDNTSFVLLSSGGQVVVNVTAGTGCPWSVLPDGLTVVSGASGTGNGAVTFSAQANGGLAGVTFQPQIGPVSVTITVAEDCTYSLSTLTLDGSATESMIAVTPSNAACMWSPSTSSIWLSVARNNSWPSQRPPQTGPALREQQMSPSARKHSR